MRGLANDVANYGITANAVLPGLTNTLAIAFATRRNETGNLGTAGRLNAWGNLKILPVPYYS